MYETVLSCSVHRSWLHRVKLCQVCSLHVRYHQDTYFVFEECSVLISPLLIPSTKVTTEIRNKGDHSLSLPLPPSSSPSLSPSLSFSLPLPPSSSPSLSPSLSFSLPLPPSSSPSLSLHLSLPLSPCWSWQRSVYCRYLQRGPMLLSFGSREGWGGGMEQVT